jgi:hypothetical protein
VGVGGGEMSRENLKFKDHEWSVSGSPFLLLDKRLLN